jgi:hypothetical protein
MRWLAQHVYFHKRGAPGLSFAEFEARLATLGAQQPRDDASLARSG